MNSVALGKVKTWIVSAWWPEQKLLADELARGRAIEVLSENLRVVGPYAFLTTGVGTPRASMALATALDSAAQFGSNSRSVFFVATAGAYDSKVSLNSAYLVSSALWSDAAMVQGKAYLPQVDKFETLSTDLSSPYSSSVHPMRALSTPAITLDAEVAHSFSEISELENLEVFGVGLAASFARVRWAAVLGVSNTVGADAHAQWKRHHQTASEAAQNLLKKCFPEELSE